MKSEIKYIPIKQLKAWGKNPRKNDKAAEKLVKLIEAHGFINPVICTRDNTIRAGHTRVKAANKAGLKEVPVIYVDMDEEQASAFAIADNKSSQYSEWDFELLKDVFEELDAFNYDLELTGFDMAEIEGLMTYAGKEEAQEDDYEIPNEIKTDIVLGDLFEIGEHRLLCGDSTDSDQVAKLMNGQKADMVFTDPPYGISYKSPSGKGKTNRGNYDIILNDDKPFEPSCLFGYCDKIITWGANHYADKLPNSAQWLVWDKREGDAINNNSDCEIAWCSFGGSARLFHHKWNGMIKASEKNEKRVHPTQKPIALIKWSFEISKAGNLILDLFLGSGSTMVASHQLKRKCYGMELDPKYCQVIIDRMKKLDSSLVIKKNGEVI